MSEAVDTNKRQFERRSINTKIEFFIEDNNELLMADSVDISDTGIRIDTEHPLKLTLRFTADGETKIRPARLVWAKKEESRHYTYGLEFTDRAD